MKQIVRVVAVLVAAAGIAFAQDASQPQSGTTPGSTKTPSVTRRQVRQQNRINQGVKSGQLTPGETARLEAREAKIQHDKQAAKADGKVTPAERRKLQREENRASRKIYKLKHNNRTQNP